MGGKKIQFGILAALIVGGGVFFQTSLPLVANNAGLVYLRAEYKALTGDSASALSLMQKVVGPQQAQAKASTPAVSTAAHPRSEPCPRTVKVKPAANMASTVPVGARLLRVRIPAGPNGRLRELVLNVPEIPSSARAQIRAAQALTASYARESEHNLRLAAKMRELENSLKGFQPALPPTPPTPIQVSVE